MGFRVGRIMAQNPSEQPKGPLFYIPMGLWLVVPKIRGIQGLFRDDGKENGSYYS